MMLAAKSIPGPETITRVVLENGMIVLVRENPSSPVAVLDGYLPVGSIHESASKAGLSAFTAAMLTRGTEHYDFDTYNETIESIGASLSVGSDVHVTHFNTTSLSDDFPTMVKVLADVLRRPTFPAEHVERVRGQWLVHLQERDQSTRQVSSLRFYELLYGDHPYGRPTNGYTETIQSISRDDLVGFFQSRYTPNGAVIVVAGDVKVEDVLALLNQHFGDWTGPAVERSVPEPPEHTAIQQEFRPLPGKIQADIVIGSLAIARNDPDFFPVQVANTILGRFGLMGRLGEVVRERQGLAYYCYSIVDADIGPGPWMAAAGVNPANIEKAVQSILSEFERMRNELVSPDELADTQANLTGSLPLRLETNAGVSDILLDMEWFGLGLDYLQRYAERINQVTREDVQRVAQKYLRTDAYTLVVAGPEIDQ
jgi:zinc protease